MELHVIRTVPQWLAIREPWNDLLARSFVRVPFLRHEFLSAWWEHLGGCGEWPHGELHVVLAYQEGRLVAAAPLFLSVDHDQHPVLAFIGSDYLADYLDLLAEPDILPTFVDALLDHLIGPAEPPWNYLALYNILESSPTLTELDRAATARGLPCRRALLATCRYVPLPSRREAYLERLGKKRRHEIGRKLRRAQQLPGFRWYIVEPASITAETADFLRLMEQHDQKRQILTPELKEQFTALVAAASRGGFLHLAFLEIEGQKAAGCLVMDYDNRLWIYNTGIDERFKQYSPGWVLLTLVMEWAIELGREAIDFLRGEQAYKQNFGAESRQIARITVRREAERSPEDNSHAVMRPDDDILTAGLGVAEIVQREELASLSSADCDVLTCRTADGGTLRLLCKFGPLAEPPQPTHRYGVGYEAQVYDQLLTAWPDDVASLHGAFLDDTTQTLGLALVHLDGAAPLHHEPQPKAGLLAAARWIACFHRWGETAQVPAFLHRYDTEFYRLWMQRAGNFTRSLHDRFPWLPELCERCQRRLPALLPSTTIIHGEYQANNILLHEGRNRPIDWESAALAAGEIDLASLTWGWDDDLVSLCEQEYCHARWPAGTPNDFALRLTAARVFLHLRWLGDADTEEGMEERIYDIKELLPLAERMSELDR